MNKKYIAKTVALTGAQAEALTACKALMETRIGATLSYAQVISILANKYQQEVE